MQAFNVLEKPIALVAITLGIVGSLNAPANAIPDSIPQSLQSSFELAQGVLVGQCRAAKQPIFIRAERSEASLTVRRLTANERVTLADNGSAGWIAVSSPATGYVQARDLKPCDVATQPPGTSAVCRVAFQALSIRSGPSRTSSLVSSVSGGNTVRLSNPQQTQSDSGDGNRTWIRITAPAAGWVSSGFPEGNFGPRFNCP